MQPLKIEYFDRETGNTSTLYYKSEEFTWGFNTLARLSFGTDTELNLLDFLKVYGWDGSQYVLIDFFFVKTKQKQKGGYKYNAVQMAGLILDSDFWQVEPPSSEYIDYDKGANYIRYRNAPDWTTVLVDLMAKGFVLNISGYPLGGAGAVENVDVPDDKNNGFPIKMQPEGQKDSEENPIIENLCYNYGNGKPPVWYIKQRTLYIFEFPSAYNPYVMPSGSWLFDSGITWDAMGRIISMGGIYKQQSIVREPKLTTDGTDIEVGEIHIKDGVIKEYYTVNAIKPYQILFKPVEIRQRKFSSGTKGLGKFDESSIDKTEYDEENNDVPYISAGEIQPAMHISGSFADDVPLVPKRQGWIKPTTEPNVAVKERHFFTIDRGQELRFFFGKKSNIESGSGYLGVFFSTWLVEWGLEGDVIDVYYRYIDPQTLTIAGAWQQLPYREKGYWWPNSPAMYGTVLTTDLHKYLEIKIVGARTEVLSRAGLLFKYALDSYGI